MGRIGKPKNQYNWTRTDKRQYYKNNAKLNKHPYHHNHPDNTINETFNCSYQNLDNLDMSQIMNVPTPINIKNLICSNNKIDELPELLPKSLQTFDCSNNNLNDLSECIFPNSLKTLICSNNKMTNLPNKWPELLETLYCSDNRLRYLPDNPPNSLRTIYCPNNILIYIPLKLKLNGCNIICGDIDQIFYNSAMIVIRKFRSMHKWRKIIKDLIIFSVKILHVRKIKI